MESSDLESHRSCFFELGNAISNFGNETIDSQLELNSNTCHVCTRKEGGSNRAPCTNAFSVTLQPTVDVGRTVLAAKHHFQSPNRWLSKDGIPKMNSMFGKKHKIQILDLVLWADTSQCVLMSTGRFTHPCRVSIVLILVDLGQPRFDRFGPI